MTVEEIKAKGDERAKEVNERNKLIEELEVKAEDFAKAYDHPEEETRGVVKDYSNVSAQEIMNELDQMIRRLEAQLNVAEAVKELFKVLPQDMVAEAWAAASKDLRRGQND